MRAVWSFWSAPYRSHYHRLWHSEKLHLLSWILSVRSAERHYPDTSLCTDSEGARMLVDQLGLSFGQVDTRLDDLRSEEYDVGWWVLGKLTTYAAQTAPFLHLDSDVFLWKPLPSALTDAAVFGQNPEEFDLRDTTFYRLEPFLGQIERQRGWLPREWIWYAAEGGRQALCCGLFGGNHLEFIRHYATSAIEVIQHPRNRSIWPTFGVRDNILVEQYFLGACLAYHSGFGTSAFAGVEAAFLFASASEAFDPERAERAGYTHLIGNAKQNREIAERLEKRVRREHPTDYERCMDYLERSRGRGRRSAGN